MNGTENYLLARKRELPKTIPACVILLMIAVMSSFGVGYAFFSSFPPEAVFRIASPAVGIDIPSSLLSLARTKSGEVIELAILAVSSFTVFSKAVILLLCLSRGLSLGCASSLYLSGLVSGDIRDAAAYILFGFASAVLFAVLAAYSSVYSDCIIRSCASGERRYACALSREYAVCFLTFSGGVLSVGILPFIIM